MAIFGLRSVTDRNQSLDPTNISGDVSVLLDVQNNDETVTGIALTLGDQVIQCRGTSADADPIAGMAESGGALEVECFFNTDAVDGACVGEQLMPLYANGDHALGAYVTTAEGARRDALATQQITLKNSGYVLLAHHAGASSMVVAGVTFHGGPSGADDENLNQFSACPVSYNGTMVGEVSLRALATGPGADTDAQVAATSLAFYRSQNVNRYGVALADDESPFMWSASSAHNTAVENTVTGTGANRAVADEMWIINDGAIKDADGLLVSDEFRSDGETAKLGPLYFDMKAPVVGANAEITIGGAAVPADRYYSDTAPNRRPQGFSVSETTDNGVGSIAAVVNVGDCSVSANTDTGQRGYGTAFVPLVENARLISELAEDDPNTEQTDDGGVDCYTAELASAEDGLGNATSLRNRTVQTANFFGVDRTPPEIDDLEPDEDGLILTGDAMVMLEVEDPDLETGEPGSGVAQVLYFTGPSNRPTSGPTAATIGADGVVQIPTTANGRDGTHSMTILVRDGASRYNQSVTGVTYRRDTAAPTFTAGSSPGAMNAGSSRSVTATVSGTIRDGNPIDDAILTLKANGGSLAFCDVDGTDVPLSSGTGMRTMNNGRDLENDSNVIEFSESFVINRGVAGGVEEFCFQLETEDAAGNVAGRGDGNSSSHMAGAFSVNWGAGMTATIDNAMIAEGGTGTITVVLDAQPTDTVKVTVASSDTLAATVPADTILFTADENDSDSWNDARSVTVTALEDPNDSDGNRMEDGMNETPTITVSALGGGYTGVRAPISVTVLDNDPIITVSEHDFTGGETTAADSVTVTATIANAVATGAGTRTINVPIAVSSDAGALGAVVPSTVAINIEEGETSGTATISVDASSATGASTWRVGTQFEMVTATITIKAPASSDDDDD